MKKILKNSIIVLSAFVFVFFAVPFGSVANTYAETTDVTAAAKKKPKCDQAFYSNNDILFYNPCAVCGGSTSGVIGEIKKLEGKNNGEKIFNFWVAAGLTSQEAAGITGSMQHEAGFSAFRQEMSQTWPAGGWGIAQFTGGQRDAATTFVRAGVGEELFNKYYKNDYGSAVSEENGFVPSGVPVEVNDQFLLYELNYLLDHISSLVPNDTRTSGVNSDYGQVVPAGSTLYTYLKSLVRAEDAAIAWTYLYEYPADIKATAAARATSARDIMTLYSDGISTTCGGGLAEGGMNLEQATKFVNDYINTPENIQYIGGAGQDCSEGPLANCVSFSIYFVNKYTTLKTKSAPGIGSTVVANLISMNPEMKNGHSPQPYAIFSTPSGSMWCNDEQTLKCGHTGIILGVDIAAGKVVVGEAGCDSDPSFNSAKEYPLSQFDSDAYTYAYTDGYLKADVQ